MPRHNGNSQPKGHGGSNAKPQASKGNSMGQRGSAADSKTKGGK